MAKKRSQDKKLQKWMSKNETICINCGHMRMGYEEKGFKLRLAFKCSQDIISTAWLYDSGVSSPSHIWQTAKSCKKEGRFDSRIG